MAETLLTRGEVSRMLGVSPKTLSAWERDGKVPPPARDWRGWRGYTPQQVTAIRDRLAAHGRAVPAAPIPLEPPHTLDSLSARNRLRGTVARIEIEGLMAEVALRLGDGQEIVSVITRSSVRGLGLSEGQEAYAVIKSTEVMIGR